MPTNHDSTGVPAMSPAEFREHLDKLGFVAGHVANDEGVSACARFFGRHPRSAQNWASEGPPAPIAVALRIMWAWNIDAGAAGNRLNAIHKRVRARARR